MDRGTFQREPVRHFAWSFLEGRKRCLFIDLESEGESAATAISTPESYVAVEVPRDLPGNVEAVPALLRACILLHAEQHEQLRLVFLLDADACVHHGNLEHLLQFLRLSPKDAITGSLRS